MVRLERTLEKVKEEKSIMERELVENKDLTEFRIKTVYYGAMHRHLRNGNLL